jgi:hypothetical protein
LAQRLYEPESFFLRDVSGFSSCQNHSQRSHQASLRAGRFEDAKRRTPGIEIVDEKPGRLTLKGQKDALFFSRPQSCRAGECAAYLRDQNQILGLVMGFEDCCIWRLEAQAFHNQFLVYSGRRQDLGKEVEEDRQPPTLASAMRGPESETTVTSRNRRFPWPRL